MPLELLDVRHQLRGLRARRSAAHASAQADMQAAVTALIRPDGQLLRRRDTVKPRPAVVRGRDVELAGDGRHDRNGILLALEHQP